MLPVIAHGLIIRSGSPTSPYHYYARDRTKSAAVTARVFRKQSAADNLTRALFGEKAFGKSQIFRLGGWLYLCTFAFFAPIAAHSLQERGQRGHIAACGAHDLLRVAAHHFQQIFRPHFLFKSKPALRRKPRSACGNPLLLPSLQARDQLFKPRALDIVQKRRRRRIKIVERLVIQLSRRTRTRRLHHHLLHQLLLRHARIARHRALKTLAARTPRHI